MANLASNKMFLDQAGVQALIKKIALIKTELENNSQDIAEDLASLTELVNTIVIKDGDNVVAQGILADVIASAAALREELGDKPADADSTVYDRLTELETNVEKLIAGDIESLKDLKAKAFTKVESSYSANDQKVEITFSNDADEVVGTAEINTADFIVHGIMQDVSTITVESDKATLPSGDVIDIPADVLNHKGDKYLVFRFKLAHENADSEISHDEIKTIFVNVNDLFNDYDFEGVSEDEDYITIDATEVVSTDAVNQNKVTIKVALGSAQKAVNDLVEGKYQATGKPVGETYRGIIDLNNDLDSEIEAREASDKAAEEVKTQVEKLTEEVEAETTGLLDRTEVAEGKIDDLETWTDTANIPVGYINDYIDWSINGATTSEPNIESYK